jgi:hypothetical protein
MSVVVVYTYDSMRFWRASDIFTLPMFLEMLGDEMKWDGMKNIHGMIMMKNTIITLPLFQFQSSNSFSSAGQDEGSMTIISPFIFDQGHSNNAAPSCSYLCKGNEERFFPLFCCSYSLSQTQGA